MPHVCIRFYVGHESKTASRNAVRKAIDQLREDCAAYWGGSTAIEGDGLFQGETGFYRERCTIVETVVETFDGPDTPPRKTEEWARRVSRKIAGECARGAGQECVLVTVQPIAVDFVSADSLVLL